MELVDLGFVKTCNELTLDWNVEDSDLALVFENWCKVKITSEIKPPLQCEHSNFSEPQGVVSICCFNFSSDAKIASQCRHLIVSLLIGTKKYKYMIYN